MHLSAREALIHHTGVIDTGPSVFIAIYLFWLNAESPKFSWYVSPRRVDKSRNAASSSYDLNLRFLLSLLHELNFHRFRLQPVHPALDHSYLELTATFQPLPPSPHPPPHKKKIYRLFSHTIKVMALVVQVRVQPIRETSEFGLWLSLFTSWNTWNTKESP